MMLAAVVISMSLLVNPDLTRVVSPEEGCGQCVPIILIADNEEPLENASRYIERGIERLKNRDFDRAKADFDAANALEPNNVQALHGRATVWTHKHEYDHAIDDLDKAIALEPTDARSLRLRRTVWTIKANANKTMADIDRAIALNSQDPFLFLQRGFAWIKERNNANAIKDFGRAIELNPKISYSYVQRAQLYASAGQTDRAIEDYTRAIELDPGYTYAYQRRGELWLKKGNMERAIEDSQYAQIEAHQQAVKAGPNRPVTNSGSQAQDPNPLLGKWAPGSSSNCVGDVLGHAIQVIENNEYYRLARGGIKAEPQKILKWDVRQKQNNKVEVEMTMAEGQSERPFFAVVYEISDKVARPVGFKSLYVPRSMEDGRDDSAAMRRWMGLFEYTFRSMVLFKCDR